MVPGTPPRPEPPPPSRNAADFVRLLAELTDRLAAKNIVVTSLHADWSSFGSWAIEAERDEEAARYSRKIWEEIRGGPVRDRQGPEVVRVSWDGREGVLSISVSRTPFLARPFEWTPEYSHRFDRTGPHVLQFAEDYLTRRLSGSEKDP